MKVYLLLPYLLVTEKREIEYEMRQPHETKRINRHETREADIDLDIFRPSSFMLFYGVLMFVVFPSSNFQRKRMRLVCWLSVLV